MPTLPWTASGRLTACLSPETHPPPARSAPAQVKHDLAKLQLTSPVCTKEGEKIALSRRVEKHWRLIGWGQIQKGLRCGGVGLGRRVGGGEGAGGAADRQMGCSICACRLAAAAVELAGWVHYK